MAAKAWVVVWYENSNEKKSSTVSANMIKEFLDDLHKKGCERINANPIRG